MADPRPQSVGVRPASENDLVAPRAMAKRHPRPPDSAPIRCQLWNDDRFVDAVPVTFDDHGNPSDVHWRATRLERVTKLAFVWDGRVFVAPFDQPRIVKQGEVLHLALAHLKLLDRFGRDAIGAGRNST